MYNATLVVQAELMEAGINAVVESYDFATFMEHRANPDQFSLYISQQPVTTSALFSSPFLLKTGLVWIVRKSMKVLLQFGTAASSEESSAKWDELQSFLYEYGAASVLGHYSGLMATSADVEGFNYFDFPLYWNVKVPA